MEKVRTIRDNAEQHMTENMHYANGQIKVNNMGKNPENRKSYYDLKSFIENEAKANPNFFRWLFDDYDITYFGTSLSKEQKEEYKEWLHDL